MTKPKRRSHLLLCAGALLVLAAVIWSIIRLNDRSTGILGEENSQRLAFINQCGWQTDITHCDLQQVRIPVKFDEVYEQYNQLQLEQGFDLRRYRANTVKKYTYEISDYAEEGSSGTAADIYAHLLVLDGEIIGADISSAEENGFTTVLVPPDADIS